MGKRRLITGMVLGATVGTVVALFDKDTRDYAKTLTDNAKSNTTYYFKHPAEAVETVRNTVDRLNQTVASGADNAINALEQVETTIDKFTNKIED
ncbi:YtxH domain-containing protein [Oceanobacillus halophilus]|uniref:YtxH domain-containing protein n=1 Tax=Oceanobacillus halophilus TaxID=930130 RepID=A0A494ZXZ6_9BACI|nr:YtxH domain-containing protein [Oceanobacillus halophilus]RKQ31375.1 YtxH domain-containing protein [Oceanobacillus halophilus]